MLMSLCVKPSFVVITMIFQNGMHFNFQAFCEYLFLAC